jgi:hypothetical protein
LLAAKQRTDLLTLELQRSAAGQLDESTALTIGHALKQSGAQLLEVDGRELGVMTLPFADGYRTVIYDNTPGGSGHVLELADGRAREWLEAAHRVLVGRDAAAHDATCERACLACLLSFEAERDIPLLDRRRGRDVLGALLNGTTPPAPTGRPRGPRDGGDEMPAPDRAQRNQRALEGQRRRARRTNDNS